MALDVNVQKTAASTGLAHLMIVVWACSSNNINWSVPSMTLDISVQTTASTASGLADLIIAVCSAKQ